MGWVTMVTIKLSLLSSLAPPLPPSLWLRDREGGVGREGWRKGERKGEEGRQVDREGERKGG